MNPKDKLIHDLIVVLVDAAQRLENSAEFNEVVSKASAEEIKHWCSAFADCWANMIAHEERAAGDPRPVVSKLSPTETL